MNQQPVPVYAEDVVQALIDPQHPAGDPLVQLIQVGMSGFGYNFYDARNVARSNDQLVRERASNVIGEAARALQHFEKRYRDEKVPPSTRENPFPPPEAMRRLKAIDGARVRCEALISTFCSAETPATDSIWFRVRDEKTTLLKLVGFDVQLSQGADRIKAAATAFQPATFDDNSLEQLDAEIAAVERAFEARRAMLRG